MSAEKLKIFRGLAQAAADAYDGSYDDNGEPVKIGLKREEGNPVLNSRVMDGFKVKFVGPSVVINYQSEIKLKEVYRGGFESSMDQVVEDIASYLKKRYRQITGESVGLKADGEIKVIVQNTSRVRTFVQAQKKYLISDVSDISPITPPSTGDLQDGFQKFLDEGGFGGKRPENDSRIEG
jgi:hypothetical protein